MGSRPQLILAVATCLAVAQFTPSLAQNTLTNGLVAYYPFNGNANDASGNGNDGTVTGAQPATDRFGAPSAAYSFNGIDEYISIADSPSLNPPTAVSASAWIKVAETRADGGIVSKWSADNAMVGQWGLAQQGGGSTGIDEFFAGDVAFSATPGTSGLKAVCTAAHVDGVWHQFLMAFDGVTVVLFKDGRVVSSATGGIGSLAVYAQPVEIGRHQHGFHGAQSHFSGLIDDVRIYNRALSAAEVAELYTLEAGPGIDITRAVKLVQYNLTVDEDYQLQQSPNLTDWTNYGSRFTATSSRATNYVDVVNDSTFWRLQQVPPQMAD